LPILSFFYEFQYKIQNVCIKFETRLFPRIKKSSQNASISEKDAFWDDFFIRAKMDVFELILLFCILDP